MRIFIEISNSLKGMILRIICYHRLFMDCLPPQTLYEVKFLASRFSYVFPFLLNQLGSVLFVYLLGAADLSLAVPISNSLTFLVTTVAGHCLGEETTSRMTWVGAGLVCAGVTLCVADKAQ